METKQSLNKATFQNNSGFTLVDLLVSIALMGLISIFTFAAFKIFNHYFLHRIEQMESNKITSLLVQNVHEQIAIATSKSFENNRLRLYRYNDLTLQIDSIVKIQYSPFFAKHKVLNLSESDFTLVINKDTLHFKLSDDLKD